MPLGKPAPELTLLTVPQRNDILESLATAGEALAVTAERIATLDPSVSLLTLQSDFAALAYGFQYLADSMLGVRVAKGLTQSDN